MGPCEHAFVTSKGSAVSQFQRALAAGNTMSAYSLAMELPRVRLEDALKLCFLLAADRDWRYEKAAKRWLERFSAETHPALAEVLMAGVALVELGQHPDSGVARSTLLALANR